MCKISIVTPVFNEEGTIQSYVNYISSLSYHSFECIVVDGKEDASTIQHISNSKIKTLVSKPGRGTQINTGITEARGDIILVLHVDTRLPYGALEKIAGCFRHDHDVVAGAFDLRFSTQEWGYSLFGYLSSLRSRMTRIPYGDQAQFFRRDTLTKLGGFKDYPIFEDVDMMRRIKKSGGNITIFKEPVLSSARRWQQEGRVYGVLRNWFILYKFYRGVSPEYLLQFYKR